MYIIPFFSSSCGTGSWSTSSKMSVELMIITLRPLPKSVNTWSHWRIAVATKKRNKRLVWVGGVQTSYRLTSQRTTKKAVKQLKAQLKAQARKKKEKQDDHIIKSRMEHTFADRRNQVVRCVSVCELKAEYSILFCAKEVSYNQNHQSVLVNSSHTHRVKVNFIISPSRMLTRKFHII